MWVPKWYFEAQERNVKDLERRVKRLELICLEEARNKIASLRNSEAGTVVKDECLTIEEIINTGEKKKGFGKKGEALFSRLKEIVKKGKSIGSQLLLLISTAYRLLLSCIRKDNMQFLGGLVNILVGC